MSCNASKGAKDLRVWLASKYCQSKGIDRSTVAGTVKVALSQSLRTISMCAIPASSKIAPCGIKPERL
jgi:hypothetical protein